MESRVYIYNDIRDQRAGEWVGQNILTTKKNEFINVNNYLNDDDNSQNYRKYLEEF